VVAHLGLIERLAKRVDHRGMQLRELPIIGLPRLPLFLLVRSHGRRTREGGRPPAPPLLPVPQVGQEGLTGGLR
jgi:hypothetical protein